MAKVPNRKSRLGSKEDLHCYASQEILPSSLILLVLHAAAVPDTYSNNYCCCATVPDTYVGHAPQRMCKFGSIPVGETLCGFHACCQNLLLLPPPRPPAITSQINIFPGHCRCKVHFVPERERRWGRFLSPVLCACNSHPSCVRHPKNASSRNSNSSNSAPITNSFPIPIDMPLQPGNERSDPIPHENTP